MSLIDYFLIISYCVTILFYGLHKGKSTKTLKDYAIGSRDFSTGAIISTIYVTSFGASALNGTIFIGYTYGLRVFVYHDLLETLGVFFTFFIAARYIHKFYGMISVGEIVSSIYGKYAGIFSGVIAVITCWVGVTSQIIAMGLIFEYFLGLSFTASLIVSTGVTICYTAVGGVRGVIWTDVIQLSLIIISIPMIINFVMDSIGGYSNLISSIPLHHLDISFSNKDNRMWLYLGIVDAIPTIYPVVLQRMLMTSSRSQVKEVISRIVPMQLLSSLMVTLLGMAFYIFKQQTGVNVETRLLLNYFIGTHLPVFFKGFAVVGIASVLMSTIDSFLNTTSVILVNDVIKPIYPNIRDDQALILTKIATIVMGVSAILLALVENSIVSLRFIVTNLWSSTVLLPLIFGMIGFKTSSYSFYVSSLCGLCASALMHIYCTENVVLLSLLPSVLAGTAGFFATHYLLLFIGQHKIISGHNELSKNRTILQNIIADTNKYRKRAKLYKIWAEIKAFNIIKFLRLDIINNGAEDVLLPMFLIITNIFPIFMHDGNIGSSKVLIIRYSGIILIFAVMFRHRMPAWYQKRWELFWHIAVIFCLPFSTTLMLIFSHGSMYWHVSMILTIFLLSISVSRSMFAIDSIVGSGLACLIGKFYDIDSLFIFPEGIDKYALCYGYCFSIIIGFVFSRRKQLRDAERTSAYVKASSIISHEISSPLGILSCSLERIKKTINKISGYDNAVVECSDAVAVGKVTISNIDNFMTLFLQNIKNAEEFAAFELSRVSLKKIIEHLLEYYPLHERKHEIIKVKYENHFDVLGNDLLLTQSFLNIIKNSLFFISGVPDATITISFEQPISGEYNVLRILDTGIGIPEEAKDKIFKKFYTQRDGGSGLGLFFCASAMQRMGGIIECDSKVGEFTKMIFKFPKIGMFRIE